MPAKVPEDAQEDANSQGSTPHLSDPPPELNCDQDGEEDFGDFQCVQDSHEPSVDNEGNEAKASVRDGEGKGVSNSSFTKTGTPPPVDRVAADEFTRFSPTLSVSTEDEFGDFAASDVQRTASVSESKDTSNIIDGNAEVSRTLRDEKQDGEFEEWTGGYISANDVEGDVKTEDIGNAGDKHDDSDAVCAEPIELEEKQEENRIVSKDNDVVKSENPSDDFNSSLEKSGTVDENTWTGRKDLDDSCKDVDSDSKDSIEKSTPLHCVQSASNDNSNDNFGNEVTEERTEPIEDKKQSDDDDNCGDDGGGGNEFGDFSKFDGDDESDFGDFDRANDDDDLDFEDLRKKVEEGDFAEDDDFGDFTDNNAKVFEAEAGNTLDDLGTAADVNTSESESGKDSVANNDDEEEFGDFATQELKAVEEASQDPACGDDEEDDFGDFAGHDWNDKEGTHATEFDDDDFGDFSQPGTEQKFVSSQVPERQDSWPDSGLMTSGTSDPVLQKVRSYYRIFLCTEPHHM